MEKNSIKFWEGSWHGIEPARVQAYIAAFDFGTDDITEFLKQKRCHKILDAGCGCGVYALKLARHGFDVDGFDIAQSAVDLSRDLMEKNGFSGNFTTADIKDTGLPSEQYDAVVSRDVIDHMTKADAKAAVMELLRLTKRGGYVLVTVDLLDEEYGSEPHIVDNEGNHAFIDGKWNGMVFHPYEEKELHEIAGENTEHCVAALSDGLMLICRKAEPHDSDERL